MFKVILALMLLFSSVSIANESLGETFTKAIDTITQASFFIGCQSGVGYKTGANLTKEELSDCVQMSENYIKSFQEKRAKK
jgi:hypothetical protein